MSATSRALGRLLRTGCLLAFAVFAVALANALFFSQDVPFLVGGPGPWIAAPRPVDTQLVAVDPSSPPVYVFTRRFDATAGETARLRARGLRSLDVVLNGVAFDSNADAGWRIVREFDVASVLRTGRNELRISVANPKGPALLQAELALGERSIVGDADWQVVPPRGNPVAAARADDTRRHPDAFLLPQPGQVLAQHSIRFALGLCACIALVVAFDLRGPAWLKRHAVPAAWAFALVLWLSVFAIKTSALPATMGFDAPAHMQYIELIRTGLRLPLADEGFSTYHPPLAHATTALVAAIFGASPESAQAGVAYRLVSFVSGAACVLFAGLTAALLWRRDERRVAVTILVAASLPVGVYMAAYLGNESMHAAWISAALFVATRILVCERARRSDLVWLGGLLGAALLTKFTAVALAPLILAFVLAKLALLEARPAREVAIIAAAWVAGMTAMSGWVYARNLWHFGDPLVWNLDVPGAASWWLQPGFHTPGWLLSFGDGMRHPVFAGFASFWDGLYSTFWGDGLVAGMQSAHTRHGAWNDDLMLVGFWLALPATVGIFWGGARAVYAGAHRGAEPGGVDLARMLLAAVAATLLASCLLLSLRLPFYAQNRASYLLAAIVPISIFAADALIGLDEALPPAGRRVGRALVFGLSLALLLVLAGSFLL